MGGAISGPGQVIASPLKVYERRNDDRDAKHYCELAGARGGTDRRRLARAASGREGQLAGLAKRWGRSLASATGLPVAYAASARLRSRLTS